jgi:hypothetical protein
MHRREALRILGLGGLGLLSNPSILLAQEGAPRFEHLGRTFPLSHNPGRILRLPFKKGAVKSIRAAPRVSEGYFYGKEKLVHGRDFHGGVDIAVQDYGVTIYAPCDGWIFASFQSFTTMTEYPAGSGKRINFGLGHHINLYIEDRLGGLWLQVGHLDTVDKDVPYIKPHLTDGEYTPVNSELYGPDGGPRHRGLLRKVKMGDPIGTVGCSGLGVNMKESPENYARNGNTWDPIPHAHIELCKRNAQGNKDSRFRWDILGWYDSALAQPGYGLLKQHPHYGLFEQGTDGSILYAR